MLVGSDNGGCTCVTRLESVLLERLQSNILGLRNGFYWMAISLLLIVLKMFFFMIIIHHPIYMLDGFDYVLVAHVSHSLNVWLVRGY
jgi:hypothetical protein